MVALSVSCTLLSFAQGSKLAVTFLVCLRSPHPQLGVLWTEHLFHTALPSDYLFSVGFAPDSYMQWTEPP